MLLSRKRHKQADALKRSHTMEKYVKISKTLEENQQNSQIQRLG